MLRLLTGSLLLLALLPAAARAADRSLEISGLSAYSMQQGPESVADSFEYLTVDKLGLLATIRIDGLEERRREKLELYLVVFDEDEDEEHKRPLLKQKRSEQFGNGEYAVEFPDFMDADAWLGEHEFSVVLEAGLKGAKSVRRECRFSLDGPPLPDVRFEEISVYSYAQGPGYDELGPGDEFVIDVTVSVADNETGQDPRLRLFAVMEDDLWYIDPEDRNMPPAPNWSEAWLHGGAGEWRVLARGRMPSFFENPYDYYHDYRVYAYVGFGDNPQRESDYIRMQLTDPDNGELRENADITARLIPIANAGQWSIRQTRKEEE